MSDADCVEFLRWALPRLGLRWRGFRRVRRQVCRRIRRRLEALELEDLAAYRTHLASHPGEWLALDACCRIPISRFYRDRAVFDALRDAVLPDLASRARARGASRLRAWSAGCASGEEPYTLALVWELALRSRFPDLDLHVVATDVDAHLLDRARRAEYAASSLRELPGGWRDRGFDRADGAYRLRPELRRSVELRREGARERMPGGPFDLILCRNLAFTYFDDRSQRAALAALVDRLAPGAALVLGAHESLPEVCPRLVPSAVHRCILRRTGGPAAG